MGAPVSVVMLSKAPVDALLWQRPPNAPVLTVVCRATFVLAPGEAVLAPDQEPIAAADRPYPDGSSRGLYAPCDLVPMKPKADIVLVGQAFAPGKQPVRSLVVRLAAGEVDKCVEAHLGRQFDLQGQLHEGQPFTSMPLVYERAAGGPETANPIGARLDARDVYGRITVPNLQPMGLEIASPADAIATACFGPIASAWPSRRALLGASAAAQQPGEWQGPYVPADLDPSYFQAAPRDQQLQSLRGDERVVLQNLHPQHPELVVRLSGLRPRTFVEGAGPAPQDVAMRADTLWIDTSRQIFTITWRGQLPLKGGPAGVRVLLALESPEHPLAWEDFQRLERLAKGHAPAPRPAAPAASAPPDDASATRTLVAFAEGATPGAVLPFAPGQSPERAPRQPSSGAGLPFHRPGESAPPPIAAPPRMLPSEETVDESVSGPAPKAWAAPREPGIVPAAVAAVVPAAPAIESPWARGAPPPIVPEPVHAQMPAVQPVPEAAPPKPAPEPAPRPAPQVAAAPLQLAWFEAASLPALRRDPRFSPILDALEDRPLDGDLDDPSAAPDKADVDERREVFEILARGGAVGEEGVLSALAAAARDDGRIVQPIVLVAGELVFAFDEIEALKATMTAASPYAGADLEAKAILDLAKEFLGSPGQPSAPAVAEGLATRIRETFEKRAAVPAGFLDAQAARALLQGRHHQRRALLGGLHARALFHTGAGQPIPTYLHEDAAAKLPAADRIRARMLAFVHPALDQNEACPAALRAAAVGIVVAPFARR